MPSVNVIRAGVMAAIILGVVLQWPATLPFLFAIQWGILFACVTLDDEQGENDEGTKKGS